MGPSAADLTGGGGTTKCPVQIISGTDSGLVSHRANCLELYGPTGNGLNEPASNGTSDTGGGGQLHICGSTEATSSNSYGQDKGGRIVFGGKYRASNDNETPFAGLGGFKQTADDNETTGASGYFSIFTRHTNGNMSEGLRVNNAGNVTGTHGTYHTSSDERIKENIISSDVGLSTLMQMRPVKFNFLEEMGLGTRTRVGFLAQEIEALVPEVVNTADDICHIKDELDDIPDMKSIEDMQLIPILVKAIQELNAKIDAL